MPRCACRSLGHIHEYAPSLSLARALPDGKNPTQKAFQREARKASFFEGWIFMLARFASANKQG